MNSDVDEAESLGRQDEWTPCELNGRLKVRGSELVVVDLESPVPPISTG